MKNLLFVFAIVFLPSLVYAQDEVTSTRTAETAETDRAIHDDEPHFPLLTIGTGGGFILRNEAAGAYVNGNFDFQTDWAFLGLSAVVGGLGNSPDDWMYTELSGYGHLLALGVSDVTYRRYIDGDEVRVLGGFSYTRMHEDIIRVDINLGLDYFNESRHTERAEEWGLQIGARVRARFWRIENFLQLAVFQNLEIGTGGIDLGGTQIICGNFDEVLAGGDLMCEVPPRDSSTTSDSGLVTWRTTGFLIHERLFLNLYEDDRGGRLGPEVELRVEKTPLRDLNIWIFVGFRAYWSPDGL